MSLIFVGKDRSLPLERSYVSCAHLDSSFASKIKTRVKWPTVKNTLAYYRTELIMAVKRFIVEDFYGGN